MIDYLRFAKACKDAKEAMTTKPQSTLESREESICGFCDQAIHLAGDEWKHNFNDSIWCRRTTATPRLSPASAAPVVDNVGLNLLRQLVGGKNALRQLNVFWCNHAEHDAGCKCFWEQCEAWAQRDAATTAAPVEQSDEYTEISCAGCGRDTDTKLLLCPTCVDSRHEEAR